MNELLERSARELGELLARRELGARELVQACLVRCEQVEPLLEAFVEVCAEQALAEAERIDAARARGEELHPLAGVPIALKDVLCSPERETNCGSRILQGFRAPYEASVLARLRQAGLIVLGRTNMDEFAMGSSTENSSRGPSRNPWNPSLVPGGSSGGSAVAVAAREAPLALGSDTGGSIRQPAALCGVVGLRPTYGRVSRYGLVAFASSLDQIGPFARSVEDAALLLELIAGPDPRDSTSLPQAPPRFSAALGGGLEGLRVGLPREFFVEDGIDPENLRLVQEAVRMLEKLGAVPVELSLPTTRYGIAAYYLICTAEASSNLARYDGVKYGLRERAETLDEMYLLTRSRGFGAEVKRRILLGTFVLSSGYYDAYYRKAQQVRTLIRRDFERAFESCDLIATPTVPGPAWPLGERVDDPLRMYLSDAFNVTISLAGLPALSLPCGFTRSRLPVGLQLIGPPLDEHVVLRAGHAYQQETDWHRARPPLGDAA